MRYFVLFCLPMLALAYISLSFPEPLFGWLLLLLNTFTLGLYGFDKLAAIKSWQRIPESYLLLYGLAGGWLGGSLGQLLFNHKTRKQPFRRYFFLTVFANISFICAASYFFY